jgi:hypothetical protein
MRTGGVSYLRASIRIIRLLHIKARGRGPGILGILIRSVETRCAWIPSVVPSRLLVQRNEDA